jgi:hypothetical protein
MNAPHQDEIKMLRLCLSLLFFLGLSVYALAVLKINLGILFNPVALLWMLGSLCWGLSAPNKASWQACLQSLRGQAAQTDYPQAIALIETLSQYLLWGAFTGALLGLIPLLGGAHHDLGSVILPLAYGLGVRYGLLMPLSLHIQRQALQP